MNLVINSAVNYVKSLLMEKLQEKLKDGETGVDAVFEDLKNNENSKIIIGKICNFQQQDKVKDILKTQINDPTFAEELKKKMPEITDENITKLKTKIDGFIDELFTCPPVAPAQPAAGGSKKRYHKQKRHRKTKKNIHKRSRGRRQYSRKF